MSRANFSSVTRLTNEKDVPEMNWLNACAPDSPAVKGEQEPGESRLKNNWIVPMLRPPSLDAHDTFVSSHLSAMNPCNHPSVRLIILRLLTAISLCFSHPSCFTNTASQSSRRTKSRNPSRIRESCPSLFPRVRCCTPISPLLRLARTEDGMRWVMILHGTPRATSYTG